MIEQYVPSLGWEDPLEKAKATHSSILACRIPWRSHKDLDTTEWLSLSEQYVDIFSIKLKIGDSNRYLYTDVHSRIIHLALCPQGSSTWYHVSNFPSFLRLNNNASPVNSAFCVYQWKFWLLLLLGYCE